MSKEIKNTQAFTIVELLVVIIVIAILVAVTIVSYGNISQNASEATLQADLSNSAKLLKLYYADHDDTYPTSLDERNCPVSPSDDRYCLKSSGSNNYTYNSNSPYSSFTLTAENSSGVSYKITENGVPTEVAASYELVSDNFNRSDGEVLTSPWTRPWTPSVALYGDSIYSNTYRLWTNNASQESIWRNEGFTATADMKLTITFTRFDPNFYLYPIVRMSSGSNPTGYALFLNPSAIKILKMTGARAFTVLTSTAFVSIGNGSEVEVSVVGNVITAKLDGSIVLEVEDSSYTEAGYAGFYADSYTGSSSFIQIDSFTVSTP